MAVGIQISANKKATIELSESFAALALARVILFREI